MIYVASPYSHFDKLVEKRRTHAVANYLQRFGTPYHFSPIIYGHGMLQIFPDMATNYEAHQKFNDMMIEKSVEMLVLNLPGWNESRGVAHEIEVAKKLKMYVHLVDRETNETVKFLHEPEATLDADL